MFWFNRVEVYAGYSFQDFTKIKDILSDAHIAYTYKMVDQIRDTRRRFGEFGMNVKYEYLYYIYVQKNDFEKARCLIADENR